MERWWCGYVFQLLKASFSLRLEQQVHLPVAPLSVSFFSTLVRLDLRLYTRIWIHKDDHITQKALPCCISAIFSIVTLLQASSLVNKSALHTLRSDRHTTVYLFLLQLAATTALLFFFFRGEYTSIRDMTCPLEDIATPPWIVIGMIITEACLNTLTGRQLAANGYQLAGQASYRHVPLFTGWADATL